MKMSSESPQKTGRRPGTSNTREQIAAAARAQFGELGYDRATFRGIAAAAGVDPALVVHFFGSKPDLFQEVMQAPPAIADALAALAEAPRDEIGIRFATIVVGGLENPVSRAVLVGRVRSAASHPDAAALVRQTVQRDVLTLTSIASPDQPELRAVLVGTSVVGLTLARYVVCIEPLASLPADEVVAVFAPTFQHYLVEPLEVSSRP
jgi:AcrR family transcriptional regulator